MHDFNQIQKLLVKKKNSFLGYSERAVDVDELSIDSQERPVEHQEVEHGEHLLDEHTNLPPHHHEYTVDEHHERPTDVQLENTVESSDMAQLHRRPSEEELIVHRTDYTELQHIAPAAEHDESSPLEHEQQPPAVHESLDDLPATISEPDIQIEQEYHEHQEHIPKEELPLEG